MRSMLSIIAIVACLITICFFGPLRNTRADFIPPKSDSTSLTGQKVFVYFAGTVHAPTPVGTEYELTIAAYGNCVRGKLLTSSDGWIELEMAGDHRRVAIPIRSVGYLITDNTPTTQP